MILIAGFSHPLTTIFFALLIAIALLASFYVFRHRSRFPQRPSKRLLLRTLSLVVTSSIPSVISVTFSKSLRIYGALVDPQLGVTARPYIIPLDYIFLMMGAFLIFLVPFSLCIIVVEVRRNKDVHSRAKFLFFLLWVITTLSIVLSSYMIPNLSRYGDRLLIFFPAPFLFAFMAQKLYNMRISISLRSTKVVLHVRNHALSNNKLLFWIILFILLIPNYVILSDKVGGYMRPFISETATRRLEWLSVNTASSSSPLFIINAKEEVLLDYADLWNNYIGAYVGEHYTFMGKLYDAVNLRMSNFDSPVLQYWADRYFKELTQAAKSKDQLSNYSIFVIEDFYQPINQGDFDFLYRIHDGVYLVNWASIG